LNLYSLTPESLYALHTGDPQSPPSTSQFVGSFQKRRELTTGEPPISASSPIWLLAELTQIAAAHGWPGFGAYALR
jgi:hypothetical protein